MTDVIGKTIKDATPNVRVGDVLSFLHGRGRIRSLSNGEIAEFRREDCTAHLREQIIGRHADFNSNPTMRVFYRVRTSGRRLRATDICVYTPEISIAHAQDLALHFMDRFLGWPGVQPIEDTSFFCELLGQTSLLTESTMQEIAGATFSAQRNNRIHLASCLSQERALSLAEAFGLQAKWLDTDIHDMRNVRHMSELLLPPSIISVLESEREERLQELAAEVRRVQIEEERQEQEQHRAMDRQRFHDLLRRYRVDPSGLREVSSLAYVCLACGEKSKGKPGRQVCICGCEWYVNHCWSCLEKVDDRDPANAHCSVCGWCYCAKCRACSLDGCSTNRYSRAFKWRDEQQNALR